MGLPPEKYSYKVIGIIMATLIDKLNSHDVSKTMFLTMFARAKETQRERPLFRDLCLIFDHSFFLAQRLRPPFRKQNGRKMAHSPPMTRKGKCGILLVYKAGGTQARRLHCEILSLLRRRDPLRRLFFLPILWGVLAGAGAASR